MLASFRDQYGKPYLPACLIVRSGAPSAVTTADALRAFRDSCGLSTILPAYEGGRSGIGFSNHFEIYPLSPGKSGRIVTNDAIVQGLHEPAGFSGQCSPLIQHPDHFTCTPSGRLLERLFKAWEFCYVRRRKRRALQRVFRSVGIAFHGCRFPADSLMLVYDVGLRLAVWVSAFEVLLHPGDKARVDLAEVLKNLGAVSWEIGCLSHKRYTVRNHPHRVSLPEAICVDLYGARNTFLHGNPIPRRSLVCRRFRPARYLSTIAPLLYRVLLERQLNFLVPTREVRPSGRASSRWLRTKAGRRYIAQERNAWSDRGRTEKALLGA